MRAIVPASLVLVLLASSLSSCSAASDDSYYAVRAVVTTGKEGSDGDVSLCWTANGSESCQDLSSSGNDFESGARQTFDVKVSPRIAHGTQFTAIALKYKSGLSIGDSWEVTGLTVTRYFGDGKAEPICAATFDQTLSNGATFHPPGCP
jgi:hypothetical protein